MKQKQRILSPKELLEKVNALPKGFDLTDYYQVIWAMKWDKGMSLREIAAWLSNEFGVAVTHMQVYRVLQWTLPNDQQVEGEEELKRLNRYRQDLEEDVKK